MPLGRLRGFSPTKMEELRLAKGLSFDAVAVACEVSSGAVRSWEAGRFVPAQDKAKKLARAFGVNVPDLTTIDPAEATLTDLRQWQGLSGPEAAEKGGIAVNAVYVSERYVSPLPDHVREGLAAAYETTVDAIDAAWKRGRTARFGQI